VVLTGGDLSVRIALEPSRVARARVLAAPAGWSTARSSAGDVARGLQGYLVNPRLGRALGAPYGVLVLDVESGSHADSLGILPGDVLVSLNEHPVRALTSDALLASRLPRQPARQAGALSGVVVRNHVRRELRLSTAPRTQRPATAPPTRLRQ
jgi:S1-C subfamily serine protease